MSQDPLPPLSPLGDRVVVLHPAAADGADGGLGGRDVDCAVAGHDPLWPLRLNAGWRLCQCLHYDLKGWYWVVERQGRMVCLDVIDDPDGLGRDGFPTALLDDEDGEPKSGIRGAYLAAKRLRKGIREPTEWERIGGLARADPDRFLEALSAVVGTRAARPLAAACLEGRPPESAAWRRARRRQLLRRVRTPVRAASVLYLGARRELHRVLHPTGLFVLVAGPDGSGKSTLAQRLPELVGGAFRRQLRYHWRPEFLPRLGKLTGKGELHPDRPHARAAYGRAASLLLLGYYWLDYLVAGWLRVWPFRVRTGLFVNERGWWDTAVDPLRYRLDVPAGLVRALGGLLPHPDLALLLEAPAEVLSARTTDIAEEELARQVTTWRSGLPPAGRHVHLDASRPLGELEREARDDLLDLLEARTVARLGAGWSALPRPAAGRFLLPRGPRTAAGAGLAIYHPLTARALASWEAARLLARLGGFRLLPRGQAPPRPVRQALAAHLPARGTMAVARTAHPGRYVALLMDGRGTCRAAAKVATDPEAAGALDREAETIATLGPLLSPPLAAPRVLAHEPGLLLLEAVAWRPRLRPWELDEEVARALGVFFRAGARRTTAGPAGPAHGDCTPWNLLRRTGDGWVLLDWEDARAAEAPFFDLFHYVIQAHAMLGRPSAGAVLAGLRDGRGRVGRARDAYAAAAGLAAEDAGALLASYLTDVEARLLPLGPGERDGTPARQRLLERLQP